MRGHRNADSEPVRCSATGKVQMSHGDARKAARKMSSRQQRDRWPMHAYRCPSCGRWHAGHVQANQRRRR